jgi:hypothetical protein
VVTCLSLIFLCLSVLSIVTGCYVEPASYGSSSYGRATDDEPRQYGKPGWPYRKPWGDSTYHPWDRPYGYRDQ